MDSFLQSGARYAAANSQLSRQPVYTYPSNPASRSVWFVDPFMVSYSSSYVCSQTLQKRNSYLQHHTLAALSKTMVVLFLFRFCNSVFWAGGGSRICISWNSHLQIGLFKFCASLADIFLAKSLTLLLTFIAYFYTSSHFRIFETFGLTESEVYLECWRIWNNTINADLCNRFA